MKKSKVSFTLLELMVFFSLLLLMGSVFGWKMHAMLQKKRFSASVEKLSSRLLGIRALAMNMQSDFKGELFREEDSWIFKASDDVGVKLPLLSLAFSEILWDGEKKDRYEFDFSTTGDVSPKGQLDILGKTGSVQWKFPDLFGVQEGKKSGPLHPDNVK